ncbi:polymer-forming cytoskeletal protein [Paenibacillus sp. D2_2]|uniref:bactofilin family protein n=1 Tax=Paenibacillus sp. D2_2 TaxID=3073092 RepID=UPI00281529CD|nr:polymer-forming cytoskeletal protein [Paenibacillus sp. D2_2]WMT42100.1 polymer-forming cytoskeletal protein [Paenibacillus sp. D2_2]
MLKKNSRAHSLTDTLIGQGSVAEGKVQCESNLRIDGAFHGEIDCKGQVIVGESGEARSNIRGANIIVAGHVIGDISTKGKLTITSNGQVDGNVSVSNLIILEGGLLNGVSTMEKIKAVAPLKEKTQKTPQPEVG